jgi:hypothetical protein
MAVRVAVAIVLGLFNGLMMQSDTARDGERTL